MEVVRKMSIQLKCWYMRPKLSQDGRSNPMLHLTCSAPEVGLVIPLIYNVASQTGKEDIGVHSSTGAIDTCLQKPLYLLIAILLG